MLVKALGRRWRARACASCAQPGELDQAARPTPSGRRPRRSVTARCSVERYVEHGRHVEIQVFADTHGNVVSLHERECSIQRRHQKIIEESPSPAVDDRPARGGWPTPPSRAARAVGYVGAGTVEFLLEPDGEFWFLEMNTRLQVEHPVTELVTGLDLVELQLAVAEGDAAARQPHSTPRCTVTPSRSASRPRTRRPATARRPGRSAGSRSPATVRVDTGVESGSTVSPYYDSMVAKVIAHGPTRQAAIRTLTDALRRAQLHGPVTNRDQLLRVLGDPAFVAGDLHTEFLDEHPCTEPDDGRSTARRSGGRPRRAGRQPRPADGARRHPVGLAQQPGGRPIRGSGAAATPPSASPIASVRDRACQRRRSTPRRDDRVDGAGRGRARRRRRAPPVRRRAGRRPPLRRRRRRSRDVRGAPAPSRPGGRCRRRIARRADARQRAARARRRRATSSRRARSPWSSRR